MAEPYIGEIRLFGGTFAPAGWYFCDGAVLAISQYEALFALIGTTYGGDGQSTFALPDLRGRLAVGAGQGPGLSAYVLGQEGGSEMVTLTSAQIPVHVHSLPASAQPASTSSPAGANPAAGGAYSAGMADSALAPVAMPGGGQPHDNVMPVLPVSFIIAYEGIFPSQS